MLSMAPPAVGSIVFVGLSGTHEALDIAYGGAMVGLWAALFVKCLR